MEIIFHGASGRTWIARDHLNHLARPLNYLNRFHHETGFSVNNVINGFKVDVTKDLGNGTATWGFGYKRPS